MLLYVIVTECNYFFMLDNVSRIVGNFVADVVYSASRIFRVTK